MPNREDNATVKSQHSCISGRVSCCVKTVSLYSSLRVCGGGGGGAGKGAGQGSEPRQTDRRRASKNNTSPNGTVPLYKR